MSAHRKTIVEDMIKNLDNKKFVELNDNLQQFVKFIFPSIKNKDIISCNNKKKYGKIDFEIVVKNIKKSVCIKNGNIVCVYKDKILKFINFLLSIDISRECILSLLSYQYADGTYDGSGNEISSFGQLLSVDYEEEIKIVEKEFENKTKLEKVINFILVDDKNGQKVDYFYFGNAKNGIYATAETVKNNILFEKNSYKHNFMRIGIFNFLPLTRGNLNNRLREKHICLLRINLKKYIKK